MNGPAACRAFEAALLKALERDGGPLDVRAVSGRDTHGLSCQQCASLSETLAVNLALVAGLSRPRPPASLLDRLRRVGERTVDRATVDEVLGLLARGSLAQVRMSDELRDRLGRIPAERGRGKVVSIEAARERRLGSRARRLLSDWRVTVAMAYAATLLIVAVLGLDPLSAARKATSNVTAAGEKAIAEARTAAEERLALARSKGSFTHQLDYRLYRTVAVGKARATAYAGLVLERIFGSEEPVRAGKQPDPARRGSGTGEPRDPSFRS